MKRVITLCISILFVFSVVFIFIPISEAAAVGSGSCGSDLSWSLDSNGVLTISGTGLMNDYDYSNIAPWKEAGEIKTLIVLPGVTSLGEYAFYECESLTNVQLPDGISIIKERAFCNCSSLTSIDLPDSIIEIGDYAFQYCDNLTSVKLPSNLTTLGNGMFYSCGFSSFEIPNGISEIGDSAFRFCDYLSQVTFPETLIKINSYAFYDCQKLKNITLPNSLEEIEDSAFGFCSSLASINIPARTTMGSQVFELCDSLTGIWVDENNENYASDDKGILFTKDKTVILQCPGSYAGSYTVPDGVTTIDDQAFAYCDQITGIVLSETVSKIGDQAFFSCEKLESITIGASVSEIGDNAFLHSASLSEIVVDERNSKYSSDNVGVLFNKEKSKIISCPAGLEDEYIIPNSVKEVGEFAFYGCDNIRKIFIPDCVEELGKSAFESCDSLTEISIPGSITIIPADCFAWCENLRSITLADTLVAIDEAAFDECEMIKTVYYCGSESAWERIAIGDDNDSLIDATIIFDYTLENTEYTDDENNNETKVEKGNKSEKERDTGVEEITFKPMHLVLIAIGIVALVFVVVLVNRRKR